jgi:hypothetical protein
MTNIQGKKWPLLDQALDNKSLNDKNYRPLAFANLN